MAGKVIAWIVGLTALFLILYYYVGTTSVASSLFYGTGSLVGRLQGRDASGALPTSYPK